MAINVERKEGLPKLREILRRQRDDIDTSSSGDESDIDFQYEDADNQQSEIAELYSYTEEDEFAQSQECFEENFKSKGYTEWKTLSETDRRKYVVYLQNELEVAERDRRVQALRSLLYLAQGVFGECSSPEDVLETSRCNIHLLYEHGLYYSLVELLSMEVENQELLAAAMRKSNVCIKDSVHLRIILSVLYTMVEVMRCDSEQESEEQGKNRARFAEELLEQTSGQELLPVTLFAMVTKFCSGSGPHFPMKKTLMLLWKTVLVSMGGLDKLQVTKNRYREQHRLPPLPEDPAEVCRRMRASSPPASATDLIDQQMPHRGLRSGPNKRLLSLNSFKTSFGENPFDNGPDNGDNMDEMIMIDIDSGGSEEKITDNFELPPTPPRPSTPSVAPQKSLPWKPKVRTKDLEQFLDHTRVKFVGFQVKNDRDSLAGLPLPIHEGVKVLKQHLYVSLSELQIKREEDIAKNPLSQPETDVPNTPAEVLFQAILPNLPQYMIALLKILLAAAPTAKTKTDSINILSDLLPEEMPTTVFQSMKLGIDVSRHKEIIVKAISGLILLMLKHFKLNHIYQFEFMSQHLVFANCIPLVLKFFNQIIVNYVTAKHSIPGLDFPTCVINPGKELSAESLEKGDNQPYCWRNVFSCINLLRILNKLTKWKHSRTMMLVVFKSAPILKRALKVRQAMMQLYILKLLKIQTKYLGRQWRKSNMKTMSAIYSKVRHRLNDDWAYGNDMDARPWDFQAEECALRACVDRFNNRRYANNGADPDFKPVDNCILSVLGQDLDLSEEFKQNYERWLDMEVFSNQIDWDQIVQY
ncbi:striatin-interacting protein 1 homolog isoform X2 [Dreissena polymorpha]|uniref:striatin-interacting protein 1 homolog isoform X2 n=1 Tax=Dreissena polymorpha TaxID=45954 RepID=UPI002264D332|nr:striatin-interacting protein 1 homolog isoform X2 [Dreissena polymorpha]